MPLRPDDSETDELLVAHANRGDAAAFEALYRRHRDWVMALAYRFTGNRDDALDVLQDAFAYFFAKFPGFEMTGSLRSFFYPTVKHLALDRRRRQRPTVDIDTLEAELPEVETTAPDGVEGIGRAVQALPSSQREVVLLRFVDDLSLEQIAAAVGAPLGTVKSRLHTAVTNLRRRLKKE